MVCSHQLFHPTDPCCGERVLCRAFPRVDWSRFTWLVTTPDAEQIFNVEPEFWRTELVGPELIFAGGGGGNYWLTESNQLRGFVADLEEPPCGGSGGGGGGGFEEVPYWGAWHYLYRGDQYLARHGGHCVWGVWNREQLYPTGVELIVAWKDCGGGTVTFWRIGGHTLLNPDQKSRWAEYEILNFSGLVSANQIDGEPLYAGWFDLFKQIQCVWVPQLEARPDIIQVSDGEERDFLQQLAAGKLSLQSGEGLRLLPNNDVLYNPTALEIVAAGRLSPGMSFGVVSDRRSPLFGEFHIFEGATMDDDGDPDDQWIVGVPWHRVTGPVTAELGVVHRFERTNDNRSLPAWVTLEMVYR